MIDYLDPALGIPVALVLWALWIWQGRHGRGRA